MVNSMKLSVTFTSRSHEILQKLGLNMPWDKFLQDYDFKCAQPPMRLEDVAYWIENHIEAIYSQYSGGKTKIQVQVNTIWSSEGGKKLNLEDEVSQHLKPGERVIVEFMALGPVSASYQMRREPQWTEQDIENLRKRLRFGLNDRVLCFCGPRWLSGHIVGTAAPDEEDLLPYLVKTDPLPGLPQNTISVPQDSNEICIQEVCFDPISQLHLVKAAAAMVNESKKPKLRFAVGDKVVCRVCCTAEDPLERWVSGSISEIWPQLPGELKWSLGEEASGSYPSVVPYKIELASGWVYGHRDDHTLVRREGMQPLARVKGISKRMELRKNEDGSKEKIDHVTEKRKRLLIESSDSE